MSTSAYYNFLAAAPVVGGQTKGPTSRNSTSLIVGSGAVGGTLNKNNNNIANCIDETRRTQANGSPPVCCSSSSATSIASTSNSSSNSNSHSSLNQFNSLTPISSSSSMASPNSTASSSSSVSSSSGSSNYAGRRGNNSHQRCDLLRQNSVTPTTGMVSSMGRLSLSSDHSSHHNSFYSTTTTMSGVGTPLQSLEPKPLKPFKSCSEYLEAMKEDLAEWLTRLYNDLELTPENLFQQLETGAILCRHANNVTQMGRNFILEQATSASTCEQEGIEDLEISEQHSSTSNSSMTDSCVGSMLLSKEQNNNSINLKATTTTSTNSPISPTSHSTGPNSWQISSAYSQISHQHSSSGNNYHRNNSLNGSLVLTTTTTRITTANQQQDRASSINWFQVKMIPFKQDACPGTFMARDNICQFILWCRSLNILDCLLFETDDLVGRKNEKSFILCMLEVARIGFKVGMPTPLIIQLEQEIDREIENDAKRQKQLELEEAEKQIQDNDDTIDSYADESLVCSHSDSETDNQVSKQEHEDEVKEKKEVVLDETAQQVEEKQVSEEVAVQKEEEEEAEEELDFGPKPQVITNDLLSLHEKVVQLLCLCTCPTQFPMVRVGDNGKYKVGDKLVIFVRILRRHIMVRVGGGWQELSEFLRVKDPCRTKSPSNFHTGTASILPIAASSTNNATTISNNNNGHGYGYGISGNNQHHSFGFNHQNSGQLVKMASSPRSRLGESSHHLNKGHNGGGSQHHGYNNHHHHHVHHQGSYRNANGQRSISGSASMSWLSHNT